ncbi:hypothetical protein J6590_102338 [Homalodisca vitripennis]|nr:hypothetical protein J6590_102338 [Homalodisca vitripennis]
MYIHFGKTRFILNCMYYPQLFVALAVAAVAAEDNSVERPKKQIYSGYYGSGYGAYPYNAAYSGAYPYSAAYSAAYPYSAAYSAAYPYNAAYGYSAAYPYNSAYSAAYPYSYGAYPYGRAYY